MISCLTNGAILRPRYFFVRPLVDIDLCQLFSGRDSFWMDTPYDNSVQKWAGYYLGNGQYSVKYSPKQAEPVTYIFTSNVPGFTEQQGTLVVENLFPGKNNPTDYLLGDNWYTDKADPQLYDGRIQGAKTVSKWKQTALLDWAKRWDWLR